MSKIEVTLSPSYPPVWRLRRIVVIILRGRIAFTQKGYCRFLVFPSDSQFIVCYLVLDLGDDILHLLQFSLLSLEHLFYLLGAIPVSLVIVLKGIDDVKVLVSDQRVLEYLEVEELVLLQVVLNDLIGKSSQHKHYVNIVQGALLTDHNELAEEVIDQMLFHFTFDCELIILLQQPLISFSILLEFSWSFF